GQRRALVVRLVRPPGRPREGRVVRRRHLVPADPEAGDGDGVDGRGVVVGAVEHVTHLESAALDRDHVEAREAELFGEGEGAGRARTEDEEGEEEGLTHGAGRRAPPRTRAAGGSCSRGGGGTG